MAVILASRYPRKPVFLGVVVALAAMTILSVGIGQFLLLLPQLIAQYLPSSLGFLTHISIEHVAAVLFLLFGIKLLYSAKSSNSLFYKPFFNFCLSTFISIAINIDKHRYKCMREK